MARTLDVVRSEIRRDRLQHWDEMDITILFGINFGRMRTRWKEKFVHFAMEQCFSICSVLEIERKIREDEAVMEQRGIEGGDDDEKQVERKIREEKFSICELKEKVVGLDESFDLDIWKAQFGSRS